MAEIDEASSLDVDADDEWQGDPGEWVFRFEHHAQGSLGALRGESGGIRR